jgi:N6-L-threonylcarbamoyladenine synthase
MTKILAIETSCDETAAAVIEDGRYIRSNIVASQIDIHRRYGGIFPEVASRQHILAIDTVVQDAVTEAKIHWKELDAIAVTCGPGLSGSLLVGVNAAKGIAMAQELPLIGVNHLEGHLYSNWLVTEEQSGNIAFPALTLIVSGGHTELVLVKNHGDYEVLGRTIDDAAGEAFDKTARLLGVGYPGGPAIQKAAEKGNPAAFRLPRAKTKGAYDFSFSGLKTAVLRIVQRYTGGLQKPAATAQKALPNIGLSVEDMAASVQWAIVDALVEKTRRAAEETGVKEVLLAGGVSANALLRQEMRARLPLPVKFPPLNLCTDNAAMIGAAAYHPCLAGKFSNLDMDVFPNLKIQ